MRAWVWIVLVAAVVVSAYALSGLLGSSSGEADEDDAGAAIRRPRRSAAAAPARTEQPPAAPPSQETPETTAVEAPPAEHEGEEPARLPTMAEDALAHLIRLMDENEASNEELILALGDVARFYDDPDVRPHRAFVAKIVKAYRTALTLTKLQRGDPVNLRDDVNVRAAELLVATGDAKVSKHLMRCAEKHLFRSRRYTPSTRLSKTMLDGLATLNDPSSLAWMTEWFVALKRGSRVRKRDPEWTAHRQAYTAMRRFTDVPGRQRHGTFDDLVKSYTPVEAAALSGERGAEAAEAAAVWGAIGEEVVATARHLAGTPRKANGSAIDSMEGLRDWYRDHEKPEDPPWADE